MSFSVHSRLPLVFVVACCAGQSIAGTLSVQSAFPSPRSLLASPTTIISVSFDVPLNTGSITVDTMKVIGRWSGPAQGPITFSGGNTVATFTPAQPLASGEQVTVILADGITAADGSTLPPGGFSYQFWTKPRRSNLILSELTRLSTRTDPDTPTRSYGGFATDLNHDGLADISIVNEDSADIRVFLNTGIAGDPFESFLTPTTATGAIPSPSDTTELNGDGNADVVVANTGAGTVSVFLGNGDGTFGPREDILPTSSPRGVATLDANGDGAIDIAAISGTFGHFAVVLNDGSGTFGAPSYYGDATGRPWGLATADMNNDGMLDLVAGKRDAQTISVWLGTGDGTFTPAASVATSRVWMIQTGDLNGDGNEDLSIAGSFSNVGAIHFGNGTGGLGPQQLYQTDPFVIATDIGDIDGDGDLDWITASFGGDWRLFLNNGIGLFTHHRDFASTLAASCSLMADINNDGTLDLALIDELQDEVIIVQNTSTVVFADGFEN